MPFDGVHSGQLPKAKRRVEKGEEWFPQGAKHSNHLNAGITSVIADFKRRMIHRKPDKKLVFNTYTIFNAYIGAKSIFFFFLSNIILFII